MPSTHSLAPPNANSSLRNRLLAALPASDQQRLAAQFESVSLRLGATLYEPGGQLQHAYFPISSIVSLQYVMASGASTSAAEVGNEGMVGVALYMGGNSTTSSAVVQTAGDALRIEHSVLKEEFARGGALQRVLLRYAQALMTQMMQTAACNRHHAVEQQLCRWLLLTLDRLSSRELIMTQDLVASMLGVRRESVTEAAGHLQQAECIRYRRGHITVLDRGALERRVCECYGVVRNELSRLLDNPV